MPKSELEKVASEIAEAQDAVANAYRSRDVNKINRADRKLADLHYQFSECSGGNIPDDR